MKPVRLSRVKGEGSDLMFVDLRVFLRGYDDEGDAKYIRAAESGSNKSGFLKPQSDFHSPYSTTAIVAIHPASFMTEIAARSVRASKESNLAMTFAMS